MFLLGFLFSQVSIYIFRAPINQIDEESLKPKNLTLIESNLEELIDYASKNNGAYIIEEYSTPEYLG